MSIMSQLSNMNFVVTCAALTQSKQQSIVFPINEMIMKKERRNFRNFTLEESKQNLKHQGKAITINCKSHYMVSIEVF